MEALEVWTCQRAENLKKKSSKIPPNNYAATMVSAARRQIIGGGAPINKSRRRPQIVGGAARPAHGSNFAQISLSEQFYSLTIEFFIPSMSPTLSNFQLSNTSDQQSQNSYFITLKSNFLLNTFMVKSDASRARLKPSRRGSHMAAHASVASLMPLSTACVCHGNDFNCNISEV